MEEEKEEKEVHWESMQPATHPAFAILQHSSSHSPAQQHPRDWSDGCVSQGWAWGRHDPAFCGSVSHHAKLPQPSSTRAPSITAFPLAHAPRPAPVCRSDSGANFTATRPARPVLLSAQGWGAGRAQGSGCTPAPVLSLSHTAPRVRVERQDPSASSHPQEHPCASPSLLDLLILLPAAVAVGTTVAAGCREGVEALLYVTPYRRLKCQGWGKPEPMLLPTSLDATGTVQRDTSMALQPPRWLGCWYDWVSSFSRFSITQ